MAKIPREHDSYKGPEFNQFEEFKKFQAEDFKSSEVVKQAMEAYKSEEVKKISFVDGLKEKVKKKKDDKLSEKLKQTSSNSLKITSSMESVGTVIVTGVVGATVVLGPALGILNTDDPSTKIGAFEITNYRVDKNDDLLNSLYIYYDDTKLKDDYYPRLKHHELNDGEYFDLEDGKNYFYIDFIEDNTYNLQFDIFDKNNEDLILSTNFTVNTTSDISFIQETYSSDHLITYNSDGTSNLYFSSNFNKYHNIDYSKEVLIYNKDFKQLNYEMTEINEFTEIKNIVEDEFFIEEKIYYKQGIGEYLIYKTTSENYNLTGNVEINASQSGATILINDELDAAAEVIVAFNDYNTEERFTLPKDKSGENFEIEFYTASSDFDIDVRYQMAPISTFNEEIPFDYEGSLIKTIRKSEHFTFELQSEINLEKVEFCSVSVNGVADTLTLYFDGYLLSNEYLGIQITDSTNTVIASKGYVKNLNDPIEIRDLPLEQELLITYMSYYDREENPNYDSNDITGSNPYYEEYAVPTSTQFLDIIIENNSYSDLYTNGEVSYTPTSITDYYITLNENNQLNAYGNVNFVNNSDHSIYLKTDLYESGTDNLIKSYKTSESLNHLNDIISNDPHVSNLYIGYSLIVEEGNISYQISPTEKPSGVIGNMLDGLLYYEGGELIYDDSTSLYSLELGLEILSDIEVIYNNDIGETINQFTIKLEDIENPTTGVLSFDLSSYPSGMFIIITFKMKVDINTNFSDTTFLDSIEIEGSGEINIYGDAYVFLA